VNYARKINDLGYTSLFSWQDFGRPLRICPHTMAVRTNDIGFCNLDPHPLATLFANPGPGFADAGVTIRGRGHKRPLPRGRATENCAARLRAAPYLASRIGLEFAVGRGDELKSCGSVGGRREDLEGGIRRAIGTDGEGGG